MLCQSGGGQPNNRFMCPPGWKTLVANASRIEDCRLCASPCQPGQYCSLPLSSKDTSSPCKACPFGYSCSGIQQGFVACKPGTYQDTAGGASCKPCAAGSFSAAEASRSCTLCPPGTYQPNAGQTSCIDCKPGYAQPLAGQSTCPACSAGTYQAAQRATFCNPCPAGTLADARNGPGQSDMSKACSICGAGSFFSLAKAAAADTADLYKCLPCPIGDEYISSCSLMIEQQV